MTSPSSTPSAAPQRDLAFDSTPAVRTARSRRAFIPCPVCQADDEQYLFHKTGVRFVRCRSCGLVYANPPASEGRQYFDIDAAGQHDRPLDRRLVVEDLARLVAAAARTFEEHRQRPPRRIVVVGRLLDEPPPQAPPASTIHLVHLTHAEADGLTADGDVTPILAALDGETDVIVLNEVLEACPRAGLVMERLAAAMSDEATVSVVFSNVRSYPAQLMRRHWPRFFVWKSLYFDTNNLTRLMDGAGLRLLGAERWETPYSLGYVAEQLSSKRRAPAWLSASGLGKVTCRLPVGTWIATYAKHDVVPPAETLSVIMPVYNEAAYVARVLEGVLAKALAIPKEIIVVESNSTDGTRDIVRRFEGTPGVTIVYEDTPRGKGAAVRRGLEVASGSIVLIQDADFEYDLDDYDALLEPLLQHRTSFVLGSRSLGRDDWKVRRLGSSRTKAFLMNVAQVGFAKTFNVLYQQRTTDVNTMFKVFRRECIDGVTFTATGFSFDLELVCKIVGNGFSPLEVPVNYVARGFDEGKKINFATEVFPSYSMLYRCRFRRRR